MICTSFLVSHVLWQKGQLRQLHPLLKKLRCIHALVWDNPEVVETTLSAKGLDLTSNQGR